MVIYRITSSYFSAGLEIDGKGNIIRTAPIIRYAFKLGIKKFLDYATRKGWTIEIINDIGDVKWKTLY